MSCLGIFAYPYSLAGCAPVDFNSVYTASLIYSFFFLANTSSFTFFNSYGNIVCQNLSLTKLYSLQKAFIFLIHVSFTITLNPTTKSNGTDRRPLSFKYFLAFSTPLSAVVSHIRSISLSSRFNLAQFFTRVSI